MQTEAHFDLRRGALHEAAHVVIAGSFGCKATAALARRPDGGGATRHWKADTKILGLLTGDAQKQVALAGIVAECIDDDAEVDAAQIEDYLMLGVIDLSTSDGLMAAGYTIDDLTECVASVNALYDDIKSLADAEE
jgi:hypothetical protein